jgi:hypothetical protein
MTWIDNNGEVRPQSWEEYCEIEARSRCLPYWMMPSCNYTPQPLHPPPRRFQKEESREKILKMRLRLFRANPHCFWCGQLTLYGAVGNPLQTTVDHLYSRLHPERVNRYREQKGVLHVLACSACNNERGVCEQQGRPFVPKLKERLEFARRADAALAVVAAVEVKAEDRHPLMRVICTLKEAIEFAREHPAR